MAVDVASPQAPRFRLCIVVCYFGRLPTWLPLYLKTCEFNPTVDFLLITDCTSVHVVPNNVRIVHLSLGEFCRRVADKLGVRITIEMSYKICDFKPTYGLLFEDLLAGWDFWGYSDLDLVFGDIRQFITDSLLSQNDLVTTRSEFLAGHFTLLRNATRLNRLYESSKDHLQVFQTPVTLCFDECGNVCQLLLQGQPLSSLSATCDSMTHVVRRLVTGRKLTAHFKTICRDACDVGRKPWMLRWNNGRLVDTSNGREVIYFHFNTMKGIPGFARPLLREDSVSFNITEDGFSEDVSS